MSVRNDFQGKVHEGMLRAGGRRFAIVAARFNDFIVDKLIDGALDALRRTGASDADIEIFRCPGAMELPGLGRRVAALGRFDAVICLGVVIRGATPHFDLVVGEAARGIAELSMASAPAAGAAAAAAGPAFVFGVLACDTIEQAVERAGTKAGNRGYDAAMVAMEMADLYAGLAAGADSSAGAARLDAARRGK